MPARFAQICELLTDRYIDVQARALDSKDYEFITDRLGSYYSTFNEDQRALILGMYVALGAAAPHGT